MHLRWRNRGKFKQQHFRTATKHRSLSGHFRSFTKADLTPQELPLVY